MKKIPLSKFDLGFVIAAAVILLLGAGGWYYLSGNLQTAQADVASSKSDFDKYSTKADVIVSSANAKSLKANIELLKAQLDPLIHAKLQAKDNKLASVGRADPVAWKHDLDSNVQHLAGEAKTKGVTLPDNFYFGFSRYVSQSPGDDQTAVLGKQLLGVEQLSEILLSAPVRSITSIRRTYEEDPHAAPANGAQDPTTSDRLPGFALEGAGGDYTAYPFEVEFQATPENLRTVINQLIQSPYLFVVRTLSVDNSKPDSPATGDLDKMAGAATSSGSSVISSSPGDVASTTSTRGPQFLFGDASLSVRARIDLIDWKANPSDETQPKK
jgi:hypothetical protein